jgi:hypothetical protein
LATLNSAIEGVLEHLRQVGLTSLEDQAEFIAQCLESWLEASGRRHDILLSPKLDPNNVAYQGRVLVSAITLLPACVWILSKDRAPMISLRAEKLLTKWFRRLIKRAGLLKTGKFIPKADFKKKGFLGSGGIGRFRDTLWAASMGTANILRLSPQQKSKLASSHRGRIYSELSK